jgi:hypothetical protein
VHEAEICRFFSKQHTLRKKGKNINGKANHRPKPKEHTGVDVFDMVKDLKVIFGKGPGRQPVPNDVDEHAPMWLGRSLTHSSQPCLILTLIPLTLPRPRVASGIAA